MEPNADDARFIQELLDKIPTQNYAVTSVEAFIAAHLHLSRDEFDVCLLDWGIHERNALSLFAGAREKNPIPFIFLTSHEEHEVDVILARAGAADYLVKKHINGPLLERAIRYALERKVAEWEIREAQKYTQTTLDALQQAHRDLEIRVMERTAALRETNRILEAEITERENAERKMKARMRQQEVVAELGQRALAGVDFGTLFAGAVTLVGITLQVDVGWFLERLPGDASLLLRASLGFPEGIETHLDGRDGRASQSGYTLAAGEPVICEDLRLEKRFPPSAVLLEIEVVSTVTVVVKTNEVPLGILGVGTRARRSFDQNDIHFLQAVANVLGAAITRNRVEGEVLRLNEDLQTSNLHLQGEIEERRMAVEALKKSAIELELAREQAETANRAKSDFLSRMSHELRTPLNSILGFAQILQMQRLTPEQHQDVEHIFRAGRHLLDLINEVLDIARIEAGRMTLSPESIQVGQIVMEAVELVRPLAAQRNIQLTNSVGTHDELYVLADRQRLKQVLLNLLSNAIKYNREGGRVKVEFTRPRWPVAEKSDQFYCVEIADTGAGLTEDEISRLFVPFERLGAEKTAVEGTGIGLTLCKRLIEAMDGYIGVESRTGEGSTFWIQLPATVPPHQLLEGKLLPQPPRLEWKRRQAKTILYIEDNLANLTVVARALGAEGVPYKIITAMQGSVGIDMAAQHKPDLVLLDIHLPDIEGDVVLKRLRAEAVTATIPIVILSADATPGQKDRLMAAGANAYLSKPLDLDLFFRVLDEQLKDTAD